MFVDSRGKAYLKLLPQYPIHHSCVFQKKFVGHSVTRAKLPYRENKEWESFSRQQSDYQRNFLIISHSYTITNACTETDKIMKERKGLSPKQVLL